MSFRIKIGSQNFAKHNGKEHKTSSLFFRLSKCTSEVSENNITMKMKQERKSVAKGFMIRRNNRAV